MATLEDVTAIVRDLGEEEWARLNTLVIAGALTGLPLAAQTKSSLQITVKTLAYYICGLLKTKGEVLENTILLSQEAIDDLEKKEP